MRLGNVPSAEVRFYRQQISCLYGYPMECSFTIKKVIKDARITDEDMEKMLKENIPMFIPLWKTERKEMRPSILIRMIKFDCK